MAASKSQGSNLAVFWAAITVLCAGIAYFSEGFGKLVLIVGLAGTLISLFGFMKVKQTEGETAAPPGNMGMKLIGIVVTWGGWLVCVVGMHLVASTTGRMVFALAGIAVSLVGLTTVLPAAFGKSSAGKITTPSFIAAKTTMEHTR